MRYEGKTIWKQQKSDKAVKHRRLSTGGGGGRKKRRKREEERRGGGGGGNEKYRGKKIVHECMT
jgi:hypothetical protein